jgi:plasmid stability protein
MKKITIALPDDLARWLRVKAAEGDRSVSRWLAELLDGMRRDEDGYEVAMRRYLGMKPRKLDWPGGRRPTREELHDRSGHKRFA